MRVLVVEDEKDLNSIICSKLVKEGYNVDACYDGQAALDYMEAENYDGAIMDIMIPNKDGITVLREMRNAGIQVPVLFLTAKTETQDIVRGLDAGASDYMTKPFSMKQLLARVEAISRRFSNSNKPLAKVFKYDDLVVDCSKMEVFLNGKFISVTPIEWRILSSMIQNQRKVYTRDELLTIAFGTDYDGFDRSVDTHIKNLRKKLGDDPRKSTYIHTVHGIGYRFGGEV